MQIKNKRQPEILNHSGNTVTTDVDEDLRFLIDNSQSISSLPLKHESHSFCAERRFHGNRMPEYEEGLSGEVSMFFVG